MCTVYTVHLTPSQIRVLLFKVNCYPKLANPSGAVVHAALLTVQYEAVLCY